MRAGPAPKIVAPRVGALHAPYGLIEPATKNEVRAECRDRALMRLGTVLRHDNPGRQQGRLRRVIHCMVSAGHAPSVSPRLSSSRAADSVRVAFRR